MPFKNLFNCISTICVYAIKTNLPSFVLKNERGFLSVLVLPVLLLLGAISQPVVAQVTPTARCTLTDIDQDNDGLIEICDLEGLNAIRYQADGSGYRTSESGDKITAGCADGGCRGYELVNDLDFNDEASYSSTSNKVLWTTGEGWQPIDAIYSWSPIIFEGNRHTISNLMINRSSNYVGLFGVATTRSEIVNIGLLDVNVTGQYAVAGLVGFSDDYSRITSSYVTGTVTGNDSVGGLVGVVDDYARITSSYATGTVTADYFVGGLVGIGSDITNSYANGIVTGDYFVGGLAGASGGDITNSYAAGIVIGNGQLSGLANYSRGNITNSYWDWDLQIPQTRGIISSGISVGTSQTTVQLQSPTTATGIYREWDAPVWDFGTSEQYPALKYSDGTLIPHQPRERPEAILRMPQIEIVGVPAGAVNEGEQITLTVSVLNNEGNIALDHRWTQTAGEYLLAGVTTGNRVVLDVPNDYVASATSSHLVLSIETSSDVGSIAHQIAITILRRNNGKVSVLGIPSLNDRELTAPTIDISDDPDGTGGNVNYQWQSRASTQTAWVNVQTSADMKETYTIPDATRNGTQYRVVISYTDGQGYREEVISGAVVYEGSPDPQPEIITEMTSCSLADIDQDDDGLIEICDIEGLDAMRYQLDGSGYRASDWANKITAGCADGGCKGYELIKDLDFNNNASYRDMANKRIWTTWRGWRPVGYDQWMRTFTRRPFTSKFEGNGHTISNLMINRPNTSEVGLFSEIKGPKSKLVNIGLLNVDIKGYRYVGGLVGWNHGSVTNSYATGTVTGTGYSVGGLVGFSGGDITNSYATGTVAGNNSVGGLVGLDHGSVTNSYATGTVTGDNSVGGLVGYSSGDITNSYATGAVTGKGKVGGLVGYNYDGSITNSYATGAVAGNNYVGGLVGLIYSSITNSYAMGTVTGDNYVGGLVGYSSGDITNSYATGAVTGKGEVGGLVGLSGGDITNSYATGAVTGNNYVGGLVGENYDDITNSYATGAVTGKGKVGGLVGSNRYDSITNSYATGAVKGEEEVGGLVGKKELNTIIVRSYWDKEASGVTTSDGGVGKTTTQLQSPTTATGIYSEWSTANWDFGTSKQYPALKHSDGKLMPNQRRQIDIVGVPANAVNEGERITLTAVARSNSNNIPLSYHWTQTSGKTLLAEPTTTSSVTLDIPDNYVEVSVARDNLVLALEVSSDIGTTTHQVTITVAKHNNGGVSTTDIPSLNIKELTAPLVDISADPDGSGSDIDYQWQSRAIAQTAWVNVQTSADMKETYTIPDTTRSGMRYRVVINYTDGQGYREEMASDVLTYEVYIGPPLAPCILTDVDRDNDGLIEICNIEGLYAMRYQLDGSGYRASSSADKIIAGCAEGGCKGYELVNDLDFNDEASYSSPSNKVLWTTGVGWLPIGIRDLVGFSAVLKGNHHTISNLMINRPRTNYMSLFGMLEEGAEIDGIDLYKVDIKGDDYVGALAGNNDGGTIRSINVSGVEIEGIYYVGGLVGKNYDGTIDGVDLYKIDIKGRTYVGGLVGKNDKGRYYVGGGLFGEKYGGIIINSSVSGDGTPTNTIVGTGNVIGGLVGENEAGDIINSYATADVRSETTGWAKSFYVGGLVGRNKGQIRNSYADSSVVANWHVGGLVGGNRGRINNSYALSTVTGNEHTGNLVGSNVGSAVIASSYWNNEINGKNIADDDRGIGKTTAELQSPITATGIYHDWDESVWDFGTPTQYPALKLSNGKLMRYQRIEESEEIPPMAQIDIIGLPAGAVNEGDRITLTAVARSTSERVLLRGRWMQTSGKTLLAEPTTASSVTLDIPDDYVAATKSSSNLLLTLEAGDRLGRITKQISITVVKRNNGGVAITDIPISHNEIFDIRELTAPSVDPSVDPDGGGSNIAYQWQRRTRGQPAWRNIQTPVGTQATTYTIPEETRSGTLYRVVMNYIDGQGYREEIRSGAVVVYEVVSGLPLESRITNFIVCNSADIDQDNDGLIEICDIEGLNAMRYQLDGSGYRKSESARKITAGCVEGGCIGYELVKDLDFNDEASYSSTSNKVLWTTGAGWLPIGDILNSFSSMFKGNGHTISNLMINREDTDNVGLFYRIGYKAKIDSIDLYRVRITGYDRVGSLVGANEGGTITNSSVSDDKVRGKGDEIGGLVGFNSGIVSGSYASVDVSGINENIGSYVGGLVGDNHGSIINSYATGTIDGTIIIGGLAGGNSEGSIQNSYARAEISEVQGAGGLVGIDDRGASITNSYWETKDDFVPTNNHGIGLSVKQLQSPTTATGIYRDWNTAVWDFGTQNQYPALKFPNGKLMPYQRIEESEEIPPMAQIEIVGVPAGAVNEGKRITLTAVARNTSERVLLRGRWMQTSGKTLLAEPTTASSVTLDIPDDYVAANESSSNLLLTLEAGDHLGRIIKQISITVAKRNNGGVAITDMPILHNEIFDIRELTAPSVVISVDPDGSGSNIVYQWQRTTMTQPEWTNIQMPAGTQATYTIPEETRSGVLYRVVMNYIDGQGYSEEVISGAVVYEVVSGLPLEIRITNFIVCNLADIDQDDDGLIEICDLEGLNAMRYQLDGSGYRASESANKITAGCAEGGCKGYELVNDLDFNSAISYSSISNKVLWTTGAGWLPIGTSENRFNAIFKANQYSISNLMINRPNTRKVGFFGWIGSEARLEGIGLTGIDISGDWGTGGLVGHNSEGMVVNSYAIGVVRGDDSVGGLIGDNYGTITNGYTHVSVVGDDYIGGLVGCNFDGATITNSYTVSSISGNSPNSGGLLGYNSVGNRITNSYWDTDISGITSGDYGVGLTTEQLQGPIATGSILTEVYYRWDESIWDFGTSKQYPALKYSDGTLMPNQGRETSEEVPQMPQIDIVGVPANAVNEGERITLSAVTGSTANGVTLSYHWTQVSGKTLLAEPTTASSVTLDIPDNYVAVSVARDTLVLALEVGSDIGTTTHQVTITVAKHNNGGVAITDISSLNIRELTAPSVDISADPDGGGSDIDYQWQTRASTQTAWVNVQTSADMKETYTIPDATRSGTQYRVVISYTDGQGYSEEIISDTVVYEGSPDPQPEIITEITSCSLADIDQDDDGLIEICDLEGLNAIRYQLDGSGYRTSTLTTKITAGCAVNGCRGYELVKDLDFNDIASYRSTSNKVLWTTGEGWQPIDAIYSWSPIIFEGNRHTISNLMINRSSNYVGLFGVATTRSEIVNIGLLDVNVTGQYAVAGLVGFSDDYSRITSSYVTGTVTGNDSVGGLVGVVDDYARITSSYATGTVTADYFVGGLVGIGSDITNSYANGIVTGDYFVGGLAGASGGDITNSYAAGIVIGNGQLSGLANYSRGNITNSYWDWDLQTPQMRGIISSGISVGTSQTTVQLQSLTTATGVYRKWDASVWNFGTSEQYPALKYSDGTLIPHQTRERPEAIPQMPQIEIVGVPAGAVNEGEQITLTVSVLNNEGNIALDHRWTQTAGEYLLAGVTTGNRVVLDVPNDYVASATSSHLVLSIETSSDVGSIVHQIAITILRRNNGKVSVLGIPSLNDRELTAPTIDISDDPDGTGGNVNYQWQSRASTQTAWVNVQTSADMKETYTIPDATRNGTQYRVVISYTDGQGYREEVISGAVVYEGSPDPQPEIISEITSCSLADIDQDDDGLIEICDLEGLNAMRYQLDGSGYRASASANKITSGCADGGCKGYELIKDLDFNDEASYSSTSNKVVWTTGSGWDPIGYYRSYPDDKTFATIFEGNSHTISNLMINRPNTIMVGLFGRTKGYKLVNIGLLNVDIKSKGSVGGLVGVNRGDITNSYATGAVTGNSYYVGGLVGYNSGDITNSYATGAVTGGNDVGGLVGFNHSGLVTNSYATGAVTGGNDVGGLVGFNLRGSISYSYATGVVTGRSLVGGLVGWGFRGSISYSYATGAVTGGDDVGGLVGNNSGDITNSYATRAVTGGDDVGGLVGNNSGDITNSYATGAVTGRYDVGGLVGYNSGDITNSYATGTVTGGGDVGGLVGDNSYGSISYSYATGAVTGTGPVGGLVGLNHSGLVTNSYWNTQTSGLATSAGGDGVASATTAQLQSPTAPGTTTTEVYYGWSTANWDFGTSSQYPILKKSDGTLLSPTLRYGLSQLRLAKGYLSPDFISIIPNYTGSVVGDTNTIQLIPIAINANARIHITGRVTQEIASGATSEDIKLNEDGITPITIVVMTAGISIEYKFNLRYYQYSGDVDRDNDGLIEIDNIEDLNAIRYQSDGTGYKEGTAPKITTGCPSTGCKGYELTRNLSFAADSDWSPIALFSGIFEGNGYTISNLTINKPNASNLGLFGFITFGAKINNIGLLDIDIQGGNDVGGLVGDNFYGSVTNSYATGAVKGRFSVGGLVGHNNYGSISNSYATGAVTGNNRVGGLVGLNHSGLVTNSYATGAVTGGNDAGGLVGENYFAGSISNSYATGAVTGNNRVGGLVGDNTGLVTNSYATGAVTGGDDAGGLVGENYRAGGIRYSYATGAVTGNSRLGGLVGYNRVSSIRYSYATGAVTGNSRVGGLVGYNRGGSSAYSYWDKEASGITTSDGGAGKTTTQLQSPTRATGIYSQWRGAGKPATQLQSPIRGSDTYSRWNVWDFGNSKQYPALKYRNGTLMPNQPRERPEAIPQMPQIDIVGVPAGAVNEGERITLSAVVRSTPRSIPLNYHWTQTSGKTVLAARTSTSSVTLDIPDNYVPSRVSASNVELALEVSSRIGSITRQISITVAKHNKGSVAITGVPSLNIRELTAPSVDISGDPDGGGSNIDYQWQTRASTQTGWVNVQTSADMKETYTIPDATRNGTQYRVVISYTDGQGYSEEVISGAVVYEGSPDPQPEIISEITSCSLADIDQDDDGLIEICDLEGLNAMRYQLDGSGYRANRWTNKITTGCANGGCRGYELVNNLDFNDEASYSSTSNKVVWTTGEGWWPIGDRYSQSPIIFEGNRHTISNLMINRYLDYVGLFGAATTGSEIVNIGLLDVNVTGQYEVAGLVGFLGDYSRITSSYVTGTVTGNNAVGGLVGVVDKYSRITSSYATGTVTGDYFVGGLVGVNEGDITNSYVTGTVTGDYFVGGLAGANEGDITNSYATGEVAGNNAVGGLVGRTWRSRVTNSYWDMYTSAIATSDGGTGKTTAQLQTPTDAGSTPTEVYYGWDEGVWDFGTSNQYPVLKYSDGTLIPYQRPEVIPQMPQIEIVGVPAGAVNEGERITLTAVVHSTSSSSIPLNYHWVQTSGKTLLAAHTSTSSVTLDIPNNYVTSSTSVVSNIELALAVSGRIGSITRQISITVAKHNNGGVAMTGVLDLNIRELTAPSVDISGDPDGGGNNIDYQWQSRASAQTAWANVQTSADMKVTYTIPDATRSGTQYRVVISYTDGQGYREEVISGAVVYEGSPGSQPEVITEITSCSLADIDQDDDGLIEICDLEGLNAMRYQLDGSGYRANRWTNKITTGCAYSYCRGYELVNDLDFNDEASYRSTSNKVLWTTGEGWWPIGDRYSQSPIIFEGNRHTISNLMINRYLDYVGLFGAATTGSEIVNIGLLDVNVTGKYEVAGLVGFLGDYSRITSSYVTGTVTGNNAVGGLVGVVDKYSRITSSYATGTVTGDYFVGGLVGNGGDITNSYATGTVTGDYNVGGLVGHLGGNITNSYAMGKVAGNNGVGGLVGRNFRRGRIARSYWDMYSSAIETSDGGTGKTTAQLQTPTDAGSTPTEVYYGWDEGVWDFGTSNQYPVLKYSDGTLIPYQRPEVIPQMPQIEIVGVPAGAVNEGERITLTAVVHSTSSSSIPLNYHWVQTSGKTLLAAHTSTSSVTLDIPNNYVTSSTNVSNIELELAVGSRMGSITRQISITVAKHNNGGVAMTGVLDLNIRELTAPSVDISGDPDGGGNNIDYQWQSRASAQSAWVNVQTPADMKVTYTIPDATRGGTQYRVVISYTDGQGYREEMVSGEIVYEGSPGSQPEVITEITSCSLADIDQDNDGLIEICDLEGLNSIRYQLDGSGYRAASTLTAKITAGCADGGCRGYELVNDLDFNDIASYSSTANKVLWTTGAGWQPLGTFSDPFNAVFDANKYTISNLMINRPDSDNVGLFSRIGSQARIVGIGLIGVDISGDWGVGSVVGYSDGVVLNSYAIGTVWGSYSTGGLVGDNYNVITNSYTNVAVSGSDYIGGIVGCNFGGGDVINSYTISSISSIESYRGGVLGWNTSGRVINSYWNTDTSGVMTNHYGEGLTTVQLQTPTDAGSTPTEVYYGWDERAWDFGTSEQYPVLKYRDGTLVSDKRREETTEISPQPRLPQIEIVGVPTGAVNEGERITLTAVFRSTSSSSIPLNYHWTQTSGKTVLAARTSTSSVTLDIPNNYVTSSTSVVSNIELALAVSGRIGNITRQISITVAKHNNGSVVIAGVPSLNIRELIAPVVDLSYDPDGGGSNITYQWQARSSAQSAWVNVQTPADMKVTYTIPDATRSGTQYRVVISYTDGQGYREEVISGAVVYEGSPGPQPEITSCSLADIDQDNDGLIEICDLEGLNSIRYQLDGSGYRAASTLTAKITAGCADGGCRGYELVNDLDFNDIASYSSTANKVLWTTGAGWQPLGTFSDPFNAVFDANKYTISNLMINRPDSDNVGLFSRIGSQARIVGIGLIGVDISGDWGVGSVVGYSDGVVLNSYAIGTVWGSYSTGGLVGDNYNVITNSYTNVAVSGSDYIGGIVGCNFGGGDVINSYTISSISSIESYRGGVLGWNTSGRVINSYWNTDTSGIMTNHYGEGLTTVQLQTPTDAGSTPTEVYYGWDERAWDFGTSKQYPVLKYRDGTLVSDKRREETTEISPQPRLPQIEIVGVPTGAVNEGERITLTAFVRSTSSSSIPLNYHWTQTSGQTLLAGHTTTSSVTLDIPDNYVTSSTNVSNIELELAAGSRIGNITRQISITVAKHNNGSVVIAGIPSLNIRELIAPLVDLSYDPDGSGSNITYQWQSRTSTQTAWANVQTPADTKVTYTIPEATRSGTQYRVVINYIDGQGYHEQVISLAIVYEGSPNLQTEIITEITPCSLVDIDQDNDGLIEICNLEGLNAMRYQLDGSGYRTNTSMDKITAGCAVGGCKGYELANDLDFNDNASYRDTTNKGIWTTGKGWQPIGTENKAFAAVFNGNNYTISNLMINTTMNQVGLFGIITFHEITKVGLLDVDIMGGRQVGGLAGRIYGSNITDSYVTGSVAGDAMVGGLIGAGSLSHITNSYAIGRVQGEYVVGGLVGSIREEDSIMNSYAATSVRGNNYIGGFVGQNRGAKIINSYAVGSIEGGMIQNHVAGLIAINSGTVIGSYWDRTVKAEGNDGAGRTTEQLKQPTAAGSTSTEVYYGWDEDVWDFGTSTQYPALKYSDGTLMPHQRFGLLDLSILEESAKLSPDFNGHVFDYRLLIDDEVDVIRLVSTATHTSATIDITSNSNFNGYIESGVASVVIPLNATATTVIMIRVELMYATVRTYRIIISRSIEQDPPVGVATAGEFFEYTVPKDMLMDDDGSMVDYEVMYLPDWMQWDESGGTVRFSGMPQVGYMDDPSKHTIEVKVDNSGGASRMINFKVQIDSPTVGTIRLMETPGGILQVNDQLSDANGILERIYVWEHCPAGASAFTELIGVNGVSYELPASGPSVGPGTAYRVTATVVDGLGQRSEHATQIELRDSDQKVIKVRVKVFLESLLR